MFHKDDHFEKSFPFLRMIDVIDEVEADLGTFVAINLLANLHTLTSIFILSNNISTVEEYTNAQSISTNSTG